MFCENQINFSNVEELGLYLFEPKEITKISDGICNMKFETLYLKGNRCFDDLINRITDIIDICLMKEPPDYNLGCASCKFIDRYFRATRCRANNISADEVYKGLYQNKS